MTVEELILKLLKFDINTNVKVHTMINSYGDYLDVDVPIKKVYFREDMFGEQAIIIEGEDE